jgi:probable phosphoglycerate mutase
MDGKSVHRVLTAEGDGETDSMTDAESPAAQGISDVSTPQPGVRPLRLLLVQEPHDAGAAPRIVAAVRRLVGPGTRVVGADDDLATRVVADLALALDAEADTSGDWSGQAPGEGADERVRTAYHSLAATGGTVVAVTSRRGVLSVLSDVLGTPVGRFWALATAAGSLTAVEVWEDGSASVAFTNRTDHLA